MWPTISICIRGQKMLVAAVWLKPALSTYVFMPRTSTSDQGFDYTAAANHFAKCDCPLVSVSDASDVTSGILRSWREFCVYKKRRCPKQSDETNGIFTKTQQNK